MNSNPLVSVLMTVYNREKYIGEAIQSVMNSTYQNWELIVVDDRSRDDSVAIAKSFEEKDERIKVYINDVNLGDYPNRNKAASYAKGKYLKYVDADDMIYRNCLEYMVNKMEEYPTAGYGLFTLSQNKTKPFPYLLDPIQAYQGFYLKGRDYFYRAPLSAILKRDIFDALGGFSGKQHVGDFEMWHKLSQNENVLILSHSHGYVWYREHEDQQMNDNRTDPFVPFKYILLSKDMLRNGNCPLDEIDKQKALDKVEYKEARAIISAARHNSFKKAVELFKSSELNVKTMFFKLNFI